MNSYYVDGYNAAKPECAAIIAERDALKAALSSGLCSRHQEPDPLNCHLCNSVKWLEGANQTRIEMIEEAQKEIAALQKIKAAALRVTTMETLRHIDPSIT